MSRWHVSDGRSNGSGPTRSALESIAWIGQSPALTEDWWQALASRAVRTLSRATWAPAPVPVEHDALVAQATSLIAGATAPLNLLARLAGALNDSRGGAAEAITRTATPNTMQPAVGTRPAPSRIPDGLSPAGDPAPLLAEAGRQEPDGAVSTAAPPTLNSLLPPLFSTQLVGASALPVAAETARQGARAEASAAEDDLDLLAEKIKRILDEEARRHGIDV